MFSFLSSKVNDFDPRIRESAIQKMSTSKQDVFREVVKTDNSSRVREAALNKLDPTKYENLSLICQVALSDKSDQLRYRAVGMLWMTFDVQSQNPQNQPSDLAVLKKMRDGVTLVMIDHLAELFTSRRYQEAELPFLQSAFVHLLNLFKEFLLPSKREKLMALLSSIKGK